MPHSDKNLIMEKITIKAKTALFAIICLIFLQRIFFKLVCIRFVLKKRAAV